jgi:transposase-like protein
LQELGRRHDIHPNQIAKWKSHFLSNANQVFGSPSSEKSPELLEKERLYKVIVQQKVESEFNLKLMRLIDDQFMLRPYYGFPRMTKWLRLDKG